jgi:hypothetical protein
VDAVHDGDAATPATAHQYGRAEPRVCTLPLRPLTPETSLGYHVIEFARVVLGVVLVPWQRAALIRMLELHPDGRLRFRTAVILVARQNGKSTLAQVLTIYLLCVWGWPVALGTAQDLETAEKLWADVVEMAETNEELAPLVAKIVHTNGKKTLKLLTPHGSAEYLVKAANRRAGRGRTGNLILMDELREHQNWDCWAAVTKTTMAQAAALILCLSNAGDVTSRVLRHLRLMAHEALGDPDGICAAGQADATGPTQFDVDSIRESTADELLDDDEDEDLGLDDLDDLQLDDLAQDADTLCLLEWSAAPGTGWSPMPKKVADRRAWAARHRPAWLQANPSTGYTDMALRNIVAAAKTDPEWQFRPEVLCQWLEGASSGPFPPGAWEACAVQLVDDAAGQGVVGPEDRIVGRVVAAVALASDRSMAYVALAGHRADGLAQVELAVGRFGEDWVRPWLLSPDRGGRITGVTGQLKGSPESKLIRELAGDPEFTARIPVLPLAGADLLDAHAVAYDAVRDGTVRHLPQPVLDIPAQTAETRVLGGGPWVIDAAKSPVDPAPLRAWVGALWLLGAHVPEAPPPAPPPVAVTRDSLHDGGEGSGGDLTSDLAVCGF